MKAARYKIIDGEMTRVIFNVNEPGDLPKGWYPSELEAVQADAQPLASPAPTPQAGAPAASRPRGRPRKVQ